MEAEERQLEGFSPSQRRFRQVVESAGDLIYTINAQGICTYANPAVLELVAYTQAELSARPSLELTLPEHRERVRRAYLRQYLRRAPTSYVELPIQVRSGDVHWLGQKASPIVEDGIFQGFHFIARDITQRKLAEEELQRALAQLRAVLNATHDGILAVDNEGKVLLTNARFREMWRIPEALLALRDDNTLLQFVADQTTDPEHFLQRVEKLYQNPEAEEEDVIRFRDGRVFERSTRPQRLQEKVVGRVWSFHDVTEQERLQAQMLHTQKLESLGALASGIAHDFNNLLTGILGNSELVKQDLPEDSPLREPLTQVEGAVYRAADLTRQMLSYSGEGRIVVQPVRLSTLVQELAPIVEAALPPECFLCYQVEPGEQLVEGDSAQLRQVFSNLLRNAAEAIAAGPGEITVTVHTRECTRETLAATCFGDTLAPGAYTCVEVKDTGCGMSQEVQARIFDPFFSTKFAGRGLGMASAMGIVRRHGGLIEVRSTPGAGSCLTVFLPVSPRAGKAPASPGAHSSLQAPAAGTLVLVVDDEPQVRRLAQRILEKAEYEVLTAADGVEALEVLDAKGDAIQAVLLDMTMPRMCGSEVLRELHRRRQDLPVILSSGYPREKVEEMEQLGDGVAFIQKPYRGEDLLSTIGEILRKSS